MGVLGVLNYSKMANWWFLIDCNTFYMISGTSKISRNLDPINWLNMDPRSPYLSPTYFKKHKKKMGTSLEHNIFHIWEFELLKMFEGLCTQHLFWKFEYLTFIKICEGGDRKMIKNAEIKSTKSWIWISYLSKKQEIVILHFYFLLINITFG